MEQAMEKEARGEGGEARGKEQSMHGFKRIWGGDLLLKIPMEGYSAEE